MAEVQRSDRWENPEARERAIKAFRETCRALVEAKSVIEAGVQSEKPNREAIRLAEGVIEQIGILGEFKIGKADIEVMLHEEGVTEEVIEYVNKQIELLKINGRDGLFVKLKRIE